MIYSNIGTVYLTNDLGYDKENIAFASVVTTPLNICFSLYVGYLASKSPIKCITYSLIFNILSSTYAVLYMFQYFPTKEEISNLTIVHVAFVNCMMSFNYNFGYVADFGMIMKVTDKRISGIHVTVLAAISNFSSFVHKFYIFYVIEHFGIYIPQAILSVISLILWFSLKN